MAKACGALFDCNGVIFDDYQLQYSAWNEFSLQIREKPLSHQEMKNNLLSIATTDGVQWMTNYKLSSDEVLALVDKVRALRKSFEKEGLNYTFMPGVTQVFDWLKEHDIPRTIVTSASIPSIRELFTTLALDRWFAWESIVCNDGTHNNKPAADPYVLGAAHIGVPASECVVFEDSPSGIISGYAAGSRQIVGIARSRGPDGLDALPGVTLVIPDFTEFDPAQLFITRKKKRV
ncbi:HAD family phosphatase [Candidatus Woesebacteria bacterium]|nr:HAD family phosphatase [Candidatus Woesebacteria bacterium]